MAVWLDLWALMMWETVGFLLNPQTVKLFAEGRFHSMENIGALLPGFFLCSPVSSSQIGIAADSCLLIEILSCGTVYHICPSSTMPTHILEGTVG